MSDKKQVTSGSIGLGGFIFLIFLFLKLAGIGMVANWSWWWVTSPLWIPFVLIIGIIIIFILFIILSNIFK